MQVQACGVCHTDLHYREGGINDDFPFLLGHEAAGVVEAVGAGRHRRRAGRLRDPQLARGVRAVPGLPARRAAVLLRHAQRDPEDDARGRHRAVPRARHRRVRREDAGRRRPVHEGRPVRAGRPSAGLLGCGVMAGLGAAINTGAVKRGQSIAVIGCGGVGLRRRSPARRLVGADTIIAIDIDDRKLDERRAVRGHAHHQLQGPRPRRRRRGDPGAHRRLRGRRRRRRGRQPRDVQAGVLRPRPRRHRRARRRAEPGR